MLTLKSILTMSSIGLLSAALSGCGVPAELTTSENLEYHLSDIRKDASINQTCADEIMTKALKKSRYRSSRRARRTRRYAMKDIKNQCKVNTAVSPSK